MEEVKLLGTSGLSIRVELALKAKCIPFDYIEEDLLNKSQLLLNSNPVHKKVPVLIHNGKPICESRIIVEYVDEVWPTTPRLMPEDPYDRYLVRFWSDFIDKKLQVIFPPIAGARSVEERSVVLKKAQEEYEQIGIIMEKGVAEMEQRGLLYDERVKELKYMDVILSPSLALFAPTRELLGLMFAEPDKCPCFHKWIQNLLTNDVMKSTLPDSDKMMKYVKTVMRL